MQPVAELVSTGSELLNGRTINRHAAFLGERLARLGIRLTRDTTVPDGLEGIRDTVAEAFTRSDLVLVTGGLGPTSDDLTRDAVAALLGRPLILHEPSLESIRERYARSSRPLTSSSERQALVVEGAAVFSNRVGSAPGECLGVDAGTLILLPGPSRELEAVYEDHVEPWLREAFPDCAPLPQHLFLVSGVAEAEVCERFEQQGLPFGDATMAYCAAPERLEIRVEGPVEAAEAMEQTADAVRAILGTAIFSEQRLSLEEVVVEALRERKRSLAVAESCTGGLLGMRLTSVPGASEIFKGGVIAYSNEVKALALDIDPGLIEREGAVSEPVAAAMAQGVRSRLQADIGIGITGIAGPGGGTEEKPVGTVCIALAGAAGHQVSTFIFSGDRAWIRERSALRALDLLRLALGREENAKR